MNRRIFSLAALIFFAASLRLFGFALEGQAWPSGQIVMQLSLGNGSGTLIDGFSSFGQSAEDALAIWNQNLSRVQFAVVLDSTVPPASGDSQNSVFFSNTVFGDSFGTDTLAVTLRLFQGSTMVEADVVFNSAQAFNSYRGPLRTASGGGTLDDFHRVALHEFGHVLGLDHPDEAGQNVIAQMNSRESDLDSLATDDINGAEFLYGGPAPTATPTPAPNQSDNLVNLSTRLSVGTGENVLIGGFIIQGVQGTSVLVRAIGPSLQSSGVSNPLADPFLELHDAAGTLIASNDDWQDDVNAAAIPAGLTPASGLESALLRTLDQGNYTAIVRGLQGSTGVGLVELYDLQATAGRVANISTRGLVQTGDRVMIGGFIIGGDKLKTVLLRAKGPSLSSSGITNPLPDPQLRLFDGNGNALDFNDDWINSAQQQQIIDSGLAPQSNLESALFDTLAPGGYTAILSDVNGDTGIALFETFDLSAGPNQ
jgi:hypothetical protein